MKPIELDDNVKPISLLLGWLEEAGRGGLTPKAMQRLCAETARSLSPTLSDEMVEQAIAWSNQPDANIEHIFTSLAFRDTEALKETQNDND